MDLGYVRVSTTKQNLTRQRAALTEAGIEETYIWADKKTGASADRPGLQALLTYARTGDTLICHTLDRLGRNIRECLNLIHQLRESGIGVRTLADPLPIDTHHTAGMGEMAVLLLALFAEMERVFAAERAAHARAIAEKHGRRAGRRRKLTDEQAQRARAAVDAGASLAAVAADYHVDRSTLHRRIAALTTAQG